MFEDELKKRIAEVEDLVCSFLPEESGFQKRIAEAMNYSFKAGGKRLRPLLMLSIFRFLSDGRDEKLIYPYMAALEMIHTYSLIHDDLPAMDNDDFRRGLPTNHKKFGEAMAILAGDGLLNYAYEIASRFESDDIDAMRAHIRAMKVLARKPGIYGMIGGQALDVELNDVKKTEEQLKFIYDYKTGALIECALMIGAIMAGASDEVIRSVEKAASDIGLAFQIVDDILDVVGDEEKLGKPVHSDEKNMKTTYVSLYGMEASKKRVRELSLNAKETLSRLGGNKEEGLFIEQLIEWLVERDF